MTSEARLRAVKKYTKEKGKQFNLKLFDYQLNRHCSKT